MSYWGLIGCVLKDNGRQQDSLHFFTAIKLLQKNKHNCLHDKPQKRVLNSGYDWDDKLLVFDLISDMGNNPSIYNEKAIQIAVLSKDPPIIPKQAIPIQMLLTVEQFDRLKLVKLKTKSKNQGCKTAGSKKKLKIHLIDVIKIYV